MTRKIKALGLALMAVFAMSAIVAQAASAVDFESNASTTILSASGSNHEFNVTGSEVRCATANFSGHVASSTTTKITISPVYTGCTAFAGFVSAKVTGFGHYGEEDTCDYVMHASGEVDLECEGSAEVMIDAGPCDAHIPEQTGLGTVSYENVANGDIKATININSITVSHTDGIFCTFSGSGEGKNGTLTGTSTVSGTTNGTTPVDIFYNDTE